MNGLNQASGNIILNLLRGPAAKRLGQAVLATVLAVQTVRLMDKASTKFKSFRQDRKDAKAEANSTVSASVREAMDAGGLDPDPAPQVVASEAAQAVLDSHKYNELRKIASERGINTKGWNKTQIAEALVAAAS